MDKLVKKLNVFGVEYELPEGGSGGGGQGYVNLTDQETGTEYKLYVSGGKLMMDANDAESEG